MHTIDHTDSHTAPLQADTTGAERAFSLELPRRAPIWPVVGGTVAPGFLGAIALALGVHGGSAEHVISGSALVIASLVIGAVGGIHEPTVRAHERHTNPAPCKLHDVGGPCLHLNCSGSRSPTVVLENGLGKTSPVWSRPGGAAYDAAPTSSGDRMRLADRPGT